ncbi:AAA family ATPase, partial [Pluralibacter gergoviae]|nr:AAA family ATPase [Pluralibacter gergoviae]ELW9444667.1 AAA family ATPase [Pluralibacter gergoviae]
MKVSRVAIRNFRRLENVQIDIEEKESIFVGPNNSGK